MIPQMTVVADLTQSEDELTLIADYAMGNCHTCRRSNVHMRHKRL